MQGRIASPWDRAVALSQGAYYACTGLWPLLGLESFLWVTGPKTDTWLVQTVGALVIAVSLPLLVGAARRRVGLELRLLGVSAALAFLLVDVTFYVQGRIGAIYLGDAALEFVIGLGWLAPLLRAGSAGDGAPAR